MNITTRGVLEEEVKDLDSLLDDIKSKFRVEINKQEKTMKMNVDLNSMEKYLLFINDELYLGLDTDKDHFFYGNIRSSKISNEKYVLGEFIDGSGDMIKGYFKQKDGKYNIGLKSYNSIRGRKFIPKYIISKEENGNEKKFDIFIFGKIKKVYPIKE